MPSLYYHSIPDLRMPTIPIFEDTTFSLFSHHNLSPHEEIKNIRKFCNDYGMKRKNGITKNEKMRVCFIRLSKSVWQGHKDSNPGHVVLETTALPTELYPYKIGISMDPP